MTQPSAKDASKPKRLRLILVPVIFLAVIVGLVAFNQYRNTPRLSAEETKLASVAGAQVEQMLIDGCRLAFDDLDAPGLAEDQISELVAPLEDSASVSGAAALVRQLRIISEDASLSTVSLDNVTVARLETPEVTPLQDGRASIVLKILIERLVPDEAGGIEWGSAPEYEVVWDNGVIIGVDIINSKEHKHREYEFEKKSQ